MKNIKLFTAALLVNLSIASNALESDNPHSSSDTEVTAALLVNLSIAANALESDNPHSSSDTEVSNRDSTFRYKNLRRTASEKHEYTRFFDAFLSASEDYQSPYPEEDELITPTKTTNSPKISKLLGNGVILVGMLFLIDHYTNGSLREFISLRLSPITRHSTLTSQNFFNTLMNSSFWGSIFHKNDTLAQERGDLILKNLRFVGEWLHNKTIPLIDKLFNTTSPLQNEPDDGICLSPLGIIETISDSLKSLIEQYLAPNHPTSKAPTILDFLE